MTDVKTHPLPPSRKWYGVSLLILLIGPLLSAYLLFTAFSAAIHTVTFYAPGVAKIYIIEPGEYSLWTETPKLQAADKMLKDLQTARITITEVKTQSSLTVAPKIVWSDKRPPVAHFSLGHLKFQRPGYYQVYATGQFLTPYKIYLRQPSLYKVLRSIAFSIFFTFLSIIGAALSAIIILIKRRYARNEMETNNQNTVISSTHPEPTSQATTWAMVCHLSGFAGFLFPLANIIVPLLIWGVKRHEFAYLDDQGKEAINFQISVTIYYLVSALLILIVIGLFLLPLLAAFQIIAMIIASIESAHGKLYRYPLTIRFLR